MELTEADLDKAYAAAFDAMQHRINARVNGKSFVVFAAHKLDQDKVPIDNLDEVPVLGKVRIHGRSGRFLNGRPTKDFESEILESPTWLDLCAIAHTHIYSGRNRTRYYLESAEIVGNLGDVQIVRLCLGK